MSVIIVTLFDYVLINNKHYKMFSDAFPSVWEKNKDNRFECNKDLTKNICTHETQTSQSGFFCESGSRRESAYT